MLNRAALSLEQAPPISVPLRFFLTAPLFLLGAGLLLLAYGPEALASRWSPVTLALTHLLTLGFLGMIMWGAMMQMLPVLAGSPVPAVLGASGVSHLLLGGGVVALVVGFLLGSPLALSLALGALAAGVGLFFLVVALALWRAPAANATITAMRYALLGLLLTALLGGLLLGRLIHPFGALDSLRLTNLHLAWGLLVWVGILVLGVAYQVVPMFQLTPEYPPWMKRLLSHLLFILVLLWSPLYLFGGNRLAALPIVLAGLVYTLFALTTLRLQGRRKRRLPDITLDFWRLGMGLLLLALPAWGLGLLYEGWLLLPGVVVLGFALSVVNGMLYKIVPFLSWFHLQHRKLSLLGGGGPRVPNMKDFIGGWTLDWQFYLHLAALAMLLLAVTGWRDGAYPAGFFLSLSALMLWYNLFKAVRRFYQVRSELEQAIPG